MQHFIDLISEGEKRLDDEYPEYREIVRQELEEGRFRWLNNPRRGELSPEERRELEELAAKVRARRNGNISQVQPTVRLRRPAA